MAAWVGRALASAATAVPVIGVVLTVSTDAGWPSIVAHLVAFVAIGVAWVIVHRRPASPVGPALAWTSAGVALVLVNDVLAASYYSPDPLPMAGLARHLDVGGWPLNVVGLFALLLVFPDGRSLGRLTAALPWTFTLGVILMVYAQWDTSQVGGVLVGEQSPGQAVAGVAAVLLVDLSVGLALVTLVVRYRRGSQRQREQMRWLALAGLAVVGSLAGGLAAQIAGAPIDASFAPLLVSVGVLVPLAVGVAMVRHDLFDVDRLLSESTAWLVTLVVSAAIFGGVVLAASEAIGAGTRLAPVSAAFVTALALLPLHQHIAGYVGRFVDRDRHVAVAAVRRFASDVRAGRREPEEIESVLREAQADPGLRLAVADPQGRWVDVRGATVPDPGGFAITTGGDTIARIALELDSARARHRVAELAKAAWVPIEVSRLRLGLRQALDEVDASRARLAEAAATERKRLEHELHDGAQQRLVATGMRLRSLQRRLPPRDSAEIDSAVAELEDTVKELRRLAHGIRPSRLDDGLGPALEVACSASPVPLTLVVGDLPHMDEARTLTAYLVVSEAVTNALKHARAEHIEVRVNGLGDRLEVEVCDDGIGGVPATGLTLLHDRVGSVGGRLHVHSPVGTGTTVRAVL